MEEKEKLNEEIRDKMNSDQEKLREALAEGAADAKARIDEIEKNIDPAIVAMHKLRPGEECKLFEGRVFRVMSGWIYRDSAAGLCYLPDEVMRMSEEIRQNVMAGVLNQIMNPGQLKKKKPDKYQGEGVSQ